MVITYVLDTSAFIYGTIPGDGEVVTTPGVYGEVKDEQSRLRLEMLSGLQVVPPEEASLQAVTQLAEATGDDQRLSLTDRELLAVALQEKAAGKDVELLTDDYSVQNIARKAGLRTRALRQKKSRYGIVWEKRCTGCGKAYPEGAKLGPEGDTCIVCGSPLRQQKRFATRSK